MARNRFAQPLYGKIIYIFETDLTKDQLSTIFDPSTYWIDVTGIDCEVGYIQEFREGEGVVWVAPPNYAPLTFEEEKDNKIALMKTERDAREQLNIEYNGVMLDFDEVSRERMDRAERYLKSKKLPCILWTCADNSKAVLTTEDFENINNISAERSSALHAQYNLLKDYIETLETSDELALVHFDMEVPEIIEDEEYTDEIIEEVESIIDDSNITQD